MQARSFSPMSEFTGSSIEAKCKPVKKYKQACEIRTSKSLKSPYGVGRYSDMAVSPTRSHLLCMKALVVPRGYSWAFTIRPNDLREDRLPRDITEGIHWLVSTRYLFSTRNSTYQFLVWGQNNVRGQNVIECSFELFQIQN